MIQLGHVRGVGNLSGACSLVLAHVQFRIEWQKIHIFLLLCHRYRTPAQMNVHMRGRDFLTLQNYTADELKYLLWMASDLKQRIKHKGEVKCFSCHLGPLDVEISTVLKGIVKKPFRCLALNKIS